MVGQPAELRRKLVIVGDGACGKTCLLMWVYFNFFFWVHFFYIALLYYCILVLSFCLIIGVLCLTWSCWKRTVVLIKAWGEVVWFCWNDPAVELNNSLDSTTVATTIGSHLNTLPAQFNWTIQRPISIIMTPPFPSYTSFSSHVSSNAYHILTPC